MASPSPSSSSSSSPSASPSWSRRIVTARTTGRCRARRSTATPVPSRRPTRCRRRRRPSSRRTGRERADETRATFENVPAKRGRGDVTRWEPVDEEELGVTRRQFLNRGLLTTVGFSITGFGAACLGFLWPTGSSGFGGKINAGKTQRHHRRDPGARPRRSTCPRHAPTCSSTRPPTSRRRRRSTAPSSIAGMEQGFVALYQKLRAPRLPRAVVPDVAVVRVPVPRLEVQPRRREEGGPGTAWPRPLRDRRERRRR